MKDELTVHSTDDLAIPELEAWASGLRPLFPVRVDERQRMLRSMEPPSWITLFAEADWWLKALSVAAGTYLAGAFSEAGKDTWRNRGKYFPAFSGVLMALGSLAAHVIRFKRQHPRSRVELALPFPNNYFGTSLTLKGDSEQIVAAEITLFVHYLPKVQALINQDIKAKNARVTGAIILELADDGSLEVRWMDATTLKQERRHIDVS